MKRNFNSSLEELELELEFRLLPSLSDLDDYLPASDELSFYQREFARELEGSSIFDTQI